MTAVAPGAGPFEAIGWVQSFWANPSPLSLTQALSWHVDPQSLWAVVGQSLPDRGKDVRPCYRGRVRGPLHVEEAGHGKTETSLDAGHRGRAASLCGKRGPAGAVRSGCPTAPIAAHRKAVDDHGQRVRWLRECHELGVKNVWTCPDPRRDHGSTVIDGGSPPDVSTHGRHRPPGPAVRVRLTAPRSRSTPALPDRHLSPDPKAPASVPPNRESSWDNLKS